MKPGETAKWASILILLIVGVVVASPVSQPWLVDSVLAATLPVPVGMLYLRLLLASMAVAGLLFLYDVVFGGSSNLQRLLSVVGAMLIGGSITTLIVVRADGADSQIASHTHLVMNALTWLVTLSAIMSAISGFVGWRRHPSNPAHIVRLWGADMPLVVSTLVLLIIGRPTYLHGDYHFIAAISSRLRPIFEGSISPVATIQAATRREFVYLSQDSFFYGVAFGGLIVQLVISKLVGSVVLSLPAEPQRPGTPAPSPSRLPDAGRASTLSTNTTEVPIDGSGGRSDGATT